MTLTPRHLAGLAGLLFAATAAIDIPHEQAQPFATPTDWVLEAVFALSLASAAATLWLLRAAAATRGVRAAWTVPALGYTVLALTAGATLVAGHDVGGPAFPVGLLLVMGGSVALLVLDLRKRLEPRGAGIVLVAAVVVMAVLGEGWGVIAWSAGWFGVAALLAPATSRAPRTEQPAGT
jgi:hypothetical protein